MSTLIRYNKLLREAGLSPKQREILEQIVRDEGIRVDRITRNACAAKLRRYVNQIELPTIVKEQLESLFKLIEEQRLSNEELSAMSGAETRILQTLEMMHQDLEVYFGVKRGIAG